MTTATTSERFKVGQRVYWNDPDGGICSGFGTITAIRGDGDPDGLEDQIFTLRMVGGSETEAVMSELSDTTTQPPEAATPRLVYLVVDMDKLSQEETVRAIVNHTESRSEALEIAAQNEDLAVYAEINAHDGLVAALESAMEAFDGLYQAVDNGTDSSTEILEDESLWPIKQLREALKLDRGE